MDLGLIHRYEWFKKSDLAIKNYDDAVKTISWCRNLP